MPSVLLARTAAETGMRYLLGVMRSAFVAVDFCDRGLRLRPSTSSSNGSAEPANVAASRHAIRANRLSRRGTI